MSLLTLPAEYAEQGLCNGLASVRPSVCLSHRLTAATAGGGFAAEHPVGRRYRSIAAGALVAPCCTQRRRSSKCGKSRKKTSQLQISATRDRFETMYIAACLGESALALVGLSSQVRPARWEIPGRLVSSAASETVGRKDLQQLGHNRRSSRRLPRARASDQEVRARAITRYRGAVPWPVNLRVYVKR